VAAAMVLAFAWFWLWQLDLPESMLVVIGGALIALPLALQESIGAAARDHMIAVTKRSLILALWGLVVFVFLYYEYGQSFNMLVAVCVVLPLTLAASRAWSAPRGRIELGLLRHPASPGAAGPPGSGILVRFSGGLLKKTEAGLHAMNDALKDRLTTTLNPSEQRG
jgi:hypothetical protein